MPGLVSMGKKRGGGERKAFQLEMSGEKWRVLYYYYYRNLLHAIPFTFSSGIDFALVFPFSCLFLCGCLMNCQPMIKFFFFFFFVYSFFVYLQSQKLAISFSYFSRPSTLDPAWLLSEVLADDEREKSWRESRNTTQSGIRRNS